MPGGGIEPPQAFWALRILSPLRLPISPSRLGVYSSVTFPPELLLSFAEHDGENSPLRHRGTQKATQIRFGGSRGSVVIRGTCKTKTARIVRQAWAEAAAALAVGGDEARWLRRAS